MLGKTGGIYATRPSQGPHKLRECLPLDLILRNKLKYATNGREVKTICMDKEVKFTIDGQVRRDPGFPVGIMDVLSIEKTGEHFRIWFDVKGRIVLRPIKEEEAKFKLLKVTAKKTRTKQNPIHCYPRWKNY